MRTIAIMTMVFLPATLFAALFAVPSLQWDKADVIQDRFWVYWAFTVPTTAIVFIIWYIVTSRKEPAANNEGTKHLPHEVKLYDVGYAR